MIKIEKADVYGWEAAIRGMRSPMNSWDKSDIAWEYSDDFKNAIDYDRESGMVKVVGKNNLKLMKQLAKAGTDHRKFMRMIQVYVDVTAPLYWWKEYDTYKVGTVANSCSTMHKIHEKDLTLDDFSHDRLTEKAGVCLEDIIDTINYYRRAYVEQGERIWWDNVIQLLPSSYNQKRTIMLNYEVLANIYHSRKNHKLDEWHTFCEWIETLPYSELIMGVEQ
jgi:hypothetical protein